MIDRDSVVREARSWIDTPFHHQARLRGVGVDCVGLVIGVAHALGISRFDTTDYAELPDPERMGTMLHENLDEIQEHELRPGDIVWLKVEIDPQHLAIITETRPRLMMIHALRRHASRARVDPRINRVVEHGLDQVWRDRIVGCFRYRGVA